MGDSDAEKGGLLSLTYTRHLQNGTAPPPPRGVRYAS